MKLFLAAAFVATLAATPAYADNNSTSVEVSASVSPTCSFTTSLPTSKVLGSSKAGTYTIGALGYTCNFDSAVDGNQVGLRISVDDGLRNAAYNDVAPYLIRWNLRGEGFGFQDLRGQSVKFYQTSIGLGEQTGDLEINIPTDLRYAGTYTSTVVYSIEM